MDEIKEPKRRYHAQIRFYEAHKEEQNRMRNLNYHIGSKNLDRAAVQAFYIEHGYEKALLFCRMEGARLKIAQGAK